MQEIFEKIKERLEKETDKWNDIYLKERRNGRIDHYADGMSDAFQEAIEIVDQVAEEYGHRDDRWIPCDIKTPKYCDNIPKYKCEECEFMKQYQADMREQYQKGEE